MTFLPGHRMEHGGHDEQPRQTCPIHPCRDGLPLVIREEVQHWAAQETGNDPELNRRHINMYLFASSQDNCLLNQCWSQDQLICVWVKNETKRGLSSNQKQVHLLLSLSHDQEVKMFTNQYFHGLGLVVDSGACGLRPRSRQYVTLDHKTSH